MAIGDLTRINTNVQAMKSLSALQEVNGNLGVRQLRLATGQRINAAEDDSAGYSISKKLEAKTRGQAQALSNIGDAKSMLTVAEGSLNTVMDILQTMKEKTVQAANDTMGTEERTTVMNQLNALRAEIKDTLEETEFNGKALFDATTDTEFDYQVGAESGDKFHVLIEAISDDSLLGSTESLAVAAMTTAAAVAQYGSNIGNLTAWTNGTQATPTLNYMGNDDGRKYAITFDDTNNQLDYTYRDSDGTTVAGSVAFDPTTYQSGDIIRIGDDLEVSFEYTNATTFGTDMAANDGDTFRVDTNLSGSLQVDSYDNASASLAKIDSAIQKISDQLGKLGDSQKRLSFKQENLNTSMTNYETARSRIADADFAKEQMEIVKLQILQQTGTAALAQANSAPQSVLSLFG